MTTGTVFLRAPAGYSGGSVSFGGHQYPIEEVIDDPELGTCLFVEVEPPAVVELAAHGFTGCVPPVGRRRQPECFTAPVKIPASWKPEEMGPAMLRIMEQLVANGFGDAKPPTRDDFEMAAAALGIPLDPITGMPVPDATSVAEGAGSPAPGNSPVTASGTAGAPDDGKTKAERRAERKAAQRTAGAPDDGKSDGAGGGEDDGAGE